MEPTRIKRRAQRLLEVPWWAAGAAGVVVIALLTVQALQGSGRRDSRTTRGTSRPTGGCCGA